MKNRARNPRLKGTRVNPLRLDPTRTTTLRRAAIADVRRRFARLALALDELIVRQDSFGLARRREGPRSPFTTNAFCPTGPGGGVDPTCSPNAGGVRVPIEQMTGDVKESERLSLPVKDGIRAKNETCSVWGDCTNQAFKAWERGEGDVYFGWAIPKENLERAYDYHEKTVKEFGPPKEYYQSVSGMFAHAWNVKDGQIIDHAMGSDRAKDYVYFGKPVPESTLRSVKHGDDLAYLDYQSMKMTTTNVFCPTGEGGGVDPSCGREGSVQDYTTDRFQQINGGLRSGVLEKHDQRIVKDVDAFLESAPKRAGATIRSFNADPETFARIESQIRSGEYSDKAYLSTRKSPTITDRAAFVQKIGSSGQVVFKVTGKSGVDVSKHSLNPGEGEVLYPRGTKFKVTKFEKLSSGTLLAELTENAMATNVFCPTGEGGGVDPSCGKADTSSIRQAIDDYSQLSYEQINDYMRGSGRFKGVAKADAKATADLISQAFRDPKIVKTTTKTEVVHRGISSDKVFRSLSRLKEGDVLVDKAFMSTSRNWEIAQAASKDLGQSEIVMRVFVPRGTKYVDARRDEKEVLLDAGTRMKILKSEKVPAGYGNRKPTLYLDVEVQKRLTKNELLTNERWELKSSPEQLAAFQEWLRKQLKWYVVGMTEDQLWSRYVQEGFRKGAGRAFDDLRSKRGPTFRSDDFLQGERRQFLATSFRRPETVEKVKILASRTFEEMVNVGEEVKLKLGRALADGLVQGKNPRDIAREMRDKLAMPMRRAETIARTEIIRAHAEGQLAAMEDLGVDEVGVMVEWSTAGDDRVCEACAPMEGVVLKLSEAHNMIPRHPNCRCSFIPANVGESRKEQVRGKTKIERQIDISARLAGDTFDVGIEIDKSRPRALVSPTKNAFCPTGPGGGVDPSCGKGSTVYHFTSEEGEAGIKESGAVRESDGLLGKAAYFTSSDSSSNVTGMKAAGKRVSATIASDNILELKGPIAAADWVDANKLPHESSDDVAGVARRLGFDVVRLKLKQGDYVLGLRPGAIKTNAFCPTGPGGGVDPTCGSTDVSGGMSHFEAIEKSSDALAERWDAPDHVVDRLNSEEKIKPDPGSSSKKAFVYSAIRQWQGSSGGPVATEIVRGAMNHAGVDSSGIRKSEGSDKWFADHPEERDALHSLGKAMYESTQKWLADKGISEIEVYRKGATDRPFSSWTTKPGWVRQEAAGEVVKRTIPAKYVLSIPATGFGSRDEHEVVVLGGHGK